MRKKRIFSLLLAGMLFCAAGCGQASAKEGSASDIRETAGVAQTEQENLPPLSVEGTRLTDDRGNPVRLKGISTHGLAWFPQYVNEDCFRQLKEDWNINTVRLALYTAESGGYCTGGSREELKTLIHKGVEYAEKCGLYVIIDWHILSDGNPNTYLGEAEAFFDEMSKAYAGHTNVLYEICNEPNGNVSWKEIKSYAERVISVIRRNDPDGVVLVGTPNWSQSVKDAAADPITKFGNIMYTLHFYAATHKESLRDSMKAALDSGLPVFVSEFGICDASGSGAMDTEEATAWLRLLEERNISCVAWNLSNKAETSAVLQSGCQKTSGFAPEDYSASGKWLIQAFGGVPSDGKTLPAASGAAGMQQGFMVETNLVDSWEENGKTYGKYILRLENQTMQAKDGWNAALRFDREIALTNGWNGLFRADGDRLSVSSMEYNRRVESGGAVEGVGFILQSEGKASIISPKKMQN